MCILSIYKTYRKEHRVTQQPQRQLGSSGIAVSALGMGCWAIGGPFWAGKQPLGWGEVDDAESLRAIERALDLGVTFFDTSDVYGTGHSEEVLGQAFAGRRERVVIATKFGNTYNEATRQLTGRSSAPSYARKACEQSLRRLQTDYIDLYQLHIGLGPDKIEPMVETLERLRDEGLIRAYGWSTDDAEAMARFAGSPGCAAVQHELNVLSDAPAMLALCAERNLASINRGPLAMGLLTGKYDSSSRLGDNDVRGVSPAWMKYFKDGRPSPEWLGRLASVREVLTSGGRTLAQGALAWLWARSPHTIPIPGFRTVAQVEENAGALALGPLSEAQLREVDALLERT
jgi:aryl-alcohol dehydrogenase-like predicted oxidoreductase